jgi:hypothetical protein
MGRSDRPRVYAEAAPETILGLLHRRTSCGSARCGPPVDQLLLAGEEGCSFEQISTCSASFTVARVSMTFPQAQTIRVLKYAG